MLEDLFLSRLPSALSAAAGSLTRLSMDANYSDRFAQQGAAPGSTLGLNNITHLTGLQVSFV